MSDEKPNPWQKAQGKCKDCDASILWVQFPPSEEYGKPSWIPMNPKPLTRYILRPHEKNDGRLVGKAVRWHQSHLETCTKKQGERQ